jgi:hypothetical protein
VCRKASVGIRACHWVGGADAEIPVRASRETRWRETEGYVFSDPSRSHRFVFVDQPTEDIDPANAWHLS